jgi:hypothetical protein
MRCSQCVLPENTPNISFDRKGVCNYCHSYQKIKYKEESELINILDSLKKKGGEYDCMVGLSGGRDSTYILLKLVKDYGMKVLAINYENPFTVPQAKANIENAVKLLNVDIVSFKDEKHNHVKSLKAALSAWLQSPTSVLIPAICIGCKPAWLTFYKVAKKQNISIIVTGGNPFEIISFKRELVGISREEESRRAFLKYIYSLGEFLKNRAYFHPDLLWAGLKSYLFGSPYAIGLKLYGRKIRWIQLYEYIEWNEEKILSRIKEELDWNHPSKLESTWRFDCRVKHIVDFLYSKTLNMTDKDEFFSKMVREGQITREKAIERLELENEIHMDEIELVLEQAGIKNTSLSDAL